MDIRFEQIPYDPEDEDADNYIGVSADECFDIKLNNNIIGRIWLSYNRSFADEDEYRSTYIEWLELYPEYRDQHLFRPVMKSLYGIHGTIYLESTKLLDDKYIRIGCRSLGEDEITGLTKFQYSECSAK